MVDAVNIKATGFDRLNRNKQVELIPIKKISHADLVAAYDFLLKTDDDKENKLCYPPVTNK